MYSIVPRSFQMKYIEQISLDSGKTWTNTGKSFKTQQECKKHIDKETPNDILDWCVGYYWVLRRNKDGVQEHYQIVRS
jgi:hypothetical protein